MGRKRQSDPLSRDKVKKFSSLELPSTTDVTSGEDLEGLINVIHDKFKRKTKEQQEKAERQVQDTIRQAVNKIKATVEEYENQVEKKFEKLHGDLKRIEADKESQLSIFKTKYSEAKEQMASIIDSVEAHDENYKHLVDTFFLSLSDLQKNVKVTVKESLAVVPSRLTPPPSAKVKKH